MKKSISVIVAIMLLFPLILSISCGESEETTTTATVTTTATQTLKTYEWDISSPLPEGTMSYEMTKDFIERVEQASNGRMKFNLYPGDLLGDYTTQMKNVSAGTQDFAIKSASTVNSPKFDLTWGFFLHRDWDTFIESLKPGNWLHDFYQEVSAECNWKYLGMQPLGFCGIVSNVKFDPSPSPKDVKIRVWSSETAKLVMQELGFSPVTIPWSELHSALMLGTVDAALGPTGAEDFLFFADAYDYAYRINATCSGPPCVMNLDLFNSLSPEDQDLLVRVAREWEEHSFETYVPYEEKKWDDVRAKVEVIEITPEQWMACAEAAHAVEWPYLEEVVGKDWLDRANQFIQEHQ